MDALIDLVNRLQDLFLKFSRSPIDLPQIVVVGAQSSGKSSVLEHIVGESFLPRGTGVVTRCPLVLQLLQAPPEEKSYGIFQHDKSSKLFTDYKEICKEIENQTERLAGKNKGICSTPISLKLYSPSFTKLTLVDLPGITKVPVGDQPADIEEQTKSLIVNYIDNPNSIILAVTPANIDMATSESLKLAKEYDPDGERTLAVITKLDLMDEGTDAFDMLSGNVIPVKLGIIGVVNRSQKDITDQKSITESLRNETEFFNTHYNSIASKNGCTYLTKKVQSILIDHIHKCLPKLLETIEEKLRTKKMELAKIDVDNLKKNELLLDLIKQFAKNYVAAVDGHSTTPMRSGELYGGARVSNVFEELLPHGLKSIKALTGLTDSSIVTDMKNASGTNSYIFVPETAFRLLVKTQIERLRGPCINSLDLVFKELKVIVEHTIRDKSMRIERYPKLQTALCSAVEEFLQSRLPITKYNVDILIDFHKAYINSRHPEFHSKAHEIFAKLNYKEDNKKLQLQETDEERVKKSCDLVKDLIQIYFSIVRNIVIDAVPKIIMHSLVNHVMENLDGELMKRLYTGNADDVNNLMEESNGYRKRVSELKEEVNSLSEARTEINNVYFTNVRGQGIED